MATWSIKSSGGDFTSIQSAHDSGSVSADDVLSVDESYATDTSTVTLTKRLTIRASGTFGVVAPTYSEATSKARISVASGSAIVVGVRGTVIEGIGLVLNGGVFGSLVKESCTIRRCVVACVDETATGYGININWQSNSLYNGSGLQAIVTIDNLAILGCKNYCLGVTETDAQVSVYHSSLVAISGANGMYSNALEGTGFLNSWACVVQGAGTCFSGTIGGDENVAQDTTAPGAGSTQSQSGVFANIGDGTEDLAFSKADGTYTVTDRSGTVADLATDLKGTTRTGSDIDPGVDEIAAEGGGFQAAWASRVNTFHGVLSHA